MPPPALPPPAIEQPAPHQASYGIVTGRAARGTVRVIVAGERPDAVVEAASRATLLAPRLASQRRRDGSGDDGGAGRAAVVPCRRGGLRAPRGIAAARRDAHVRIRVLARKLRGLAREFAGTAGVYVQSLTGGAGGAWNAKAQFPAASTLKLAIAATVLAEHSGIPPPGSRIHASCSR